MVTITAAEMEEGGVESVKIITLHWKTFALT